LIYESDHLKKEINYCIAFKGEDEDIELVPMDEFLAVAEKPEITEDKHALRMARSEFELQQRKEYAKQCKELDVNKEKIVKIKENLDSLELCLLNVCKATQQIQKLLELPFEIELEMQKIVRLLPQPLDMASQESRERKKSRTTTIPRMHSMKMTTRRTKIVTKDKT
jgi:THO complex subunit 5